jgi:integrase
LVGIQTGLRVSELIGLRRSDIILGTWAHVRCEGKGRKERCTPLRREAVELLTQWLRECPAESTAPAFPSSRGGPLSRDAVERLVTRHQRSAERHCPSLKRKRVTPHVLRHTAAMQLLLHGIDRSVIALWLGHESVETTQMYLHADLRLKEEALSKVTPLDVRPGRFRPDDELLAFLAGL